MDLESLGRDLDAASRGGNPVILFGRSDESIIGAYASCDGWIPCRWNLDGTFVDVANPRGLDLEIVD